MLLIPEIMSIIEKNLYVVTASPAPRWSHICYHFYDLIIGCWRQHNPYQLKWFDSQCSVVLNIDKWEFSEAPDESPWLHSDDDFSPTSSTTLLTCHSFLYVSFFCVVANINDIKAFVACILISWSYDFIWEGSSLKCQQDIITLHQFFWTIITITLNSSIYVFVFLFQRWWNITCW